MTLGSSVKSKTEEKRVLNWQKEVAKSNASRAPSDQPSTNRRIVNHITTPTFTVSRATPQPHHPEGEISTRGIIGTILGAGAGAVVAYAMAKGEHESHSAQNASRLTQRFKRVTETAIIMQPPLADARNYQPQPRSRRSISSPRLDTLASSARSHREPQTEIIRSIQPFTQSHNGQTIIQTRNGTKILTGSANSRSSHTSSRSKRDIPLPESRASTLISRHDTIKPNESISQVSTKIPRYSGKSSRRQGGTGHRRHSSYSSS